MWKAGLQELLISICGLVTLVLIIRRRKRGNTNERFPPGPFAWPIIGHLHLLHVPHQTLRDVSKTYGPIVGLRLGQHRAVVISSPEVAKEVLLTHDRVFADRPPMDFASLVLYGPNNDIFLGSYGPELRKHRKICTLSLFTAQRLRELEYVRQEEIAALLRRIQEESCGGIAAVHLRRCLGQMASDLIMRLLQSRATFEAEGENLQEIFEDIEDEVRTPTVGDLFPCLSWLDFLRKRRMCRLHARLDKVYTAMLVEHKGSTSQHDDFLCDLLFKEEGLTLDEIKSMLHDMLGGGVHTTAVTLEWAMAELLRKPECLHRLQREIDRVMGMKKQVNDSDVSKLSYLQCIVKEVFRLHPVAPLLLPHISNEECKVDGYTLPANTRMFVNVWAIGRDEQVWPNANEFMPERFEGKDKDMDVKGRHYELLPFGSGRRICLGLPLALSIIHVTLANLVNRFDWELPCGETHTSMNMDEMSGMLVSKATPLLAIPKALRV